MRKISKRNIKYGGTVIVLFITAIICHILSFVADDYWVKVLVGNIRSFIYIGIILWWQILIQRRVMDKKIRRYLVIVAGLMVFWLLTKEFRFKFAIDPVFLRYVWYLYYLPMIFIPLLSIIISTNVNRGEKYKFPKWIYALIVLTSTFALLVLTNDFHELVFKFTDERKTFYEGSYRFNVVYVLIVDLNIILYTTSMVVMIVKCWKQDKNKIWIPVFPFIFATTYVILYANEFEVVVKYAGDVAIFYCLVYVTYFEALIQTCMIRSNIRYKELFNATLGINIQIVDNDYNIFESAENAEKIPVEIMKKAHDGPISEEEIIVRNTDINGGHVIWTEDRSELMKLHEDLKDIKEELEERNALLKYEYEKEKEFKTTEEQNRLYDLLQTKTQKELNNINFLVSNYKKSTDEAEKKRIIAYIIVIGSFIKRRRDMLLAKEDDNDVHPDRLRNALHETMYGLRYFDVEGSYYVENDESGFSAIEALRSFDFYETILGFVIDHIKFISVTVSKINGKLRVRVMTDYKASSKMILEKFPDTVIEEDEGEFTYYREIKGGTI